MTYVAKVEENAKASKIYSSSGDNVGLVQSTPASTEFKDTNRVSTDMQTPIRTLIVLRESVLGLACLHFLNFLQKQTILLVIANIMYVFS